MPFTPHRNKVALAGVLLMALAGSPASAALLKLDADGKLMGATGVVVGSMVHDVDFVEGTFRNVFGLNNNILQPFTFTTNQDALLASQALLDSVFVDTPQGNFDSDPSLTIGCPNFQTGCLVVTPYVRGFSGPIPIYQYVHAYNAVLPSEEGVLTRQNLQNDQTVRVFALWSAGVPAAQVPEPASGALVTLALMGLWATARGRRKADRA